MPDASAVGWWSMCGSSRSSRWPTASCSVSPRTTNCASVMDALRSEASSPSCSVSGIPLSWLFHALQGMRQTTLVPVAGIAVHDAFRDHAIDEALRIAQHLGGGGLIAGGDGLLHVLMAVRTEVRSLML